jgi:hypothetical protein
VSEIDYIQGKHFMKALHEAGLLPEWPMLTRLIIDVVPDQPVMMHVERIGSKRLVEVVIEAGPRIEVTEL